MHAQANRRGEGCSCSDGVLEIEAHAFRKSRHPCRVQSALSRGRRIPQIIQRQRSAHTVTVLLQAAALERVVERGGRHLELCERAIALVAKVLDSRLAGEKCVNHHTAGGGEEGNTGSEFRRRLLRVGDLVE